MNRPLSGFDHQTTPSNWIEWEATGLSAARRRSSTTFVAVAGNSAAGRAWPLLTVTARIAKGKPVNPRTPRKKVECTKASLSKANGICTLFGVQNTVKIRNQSELVLGFRL